ncbi:MAG: hypothetical protein CVV64_17650 [Candidatus Wallbacteria bacterium HGW-Wallbacteria-1]|uniref:SIMPL domain-containing protein n=1 Tax=Candidatus Wallbacteria bacterium HGW-Wallbacteria-1 TaxID=2013854 RepID=A0A2N1PJZ0_9BACT|nr:MAG: hypothetical protein CVV64_17650 [Candidatus Wallbacteria bacterium HGW-Wallbacteria-1]
MRIFIAILIMITFIPVSHSFELPKFPFISVKGNSECKIQPNIFTITFTLHITNDDFNATINEFTANSDSVIKELIKLKVKPENIKAYEISSGKCSSWNRENGEKKFFASRVFNVELDDVTNYRQLIDYVIKSDDFRNVDSNFRHSDIDKIKNNLLVEACANSKEKAQLLAKTLKKEIKSIFAISESNYDQLEIQYRFPLGGNQLFNYEVRNHEVPRDSKAIDIFVPDKITYTCSLYALYRLEE